MSFLLYEMIILIPLGGTGERFKKLGYKKPKPLINVMGKPIIFWLLDNLIVDNIRMVIIPFNNELDKYNFKNLLVNRYPKINFRFLKLGNKTEGAAETILRGLNILDIPDCPVLCMDGDNFYTHNIVSQWGGDNCIFYFNDASGSDAYSFLNIDIDGKIVDIVEKVRISNYASCGAYGFKSFNLLKKYCELLLNLNIRQKEEFYVSGVIKLMIRDGQIFYGKKVDPNNYVCLGTPIDIRLFCNNYPKVNSLNNSIVLESQRYCFDLDNTLVTHPEVPGDYSTVKPIEANVEFLRYLKKLGHTIIIYTARRMKTHQGNVGKIVADIGKITLDTLEKFGIPYDEIYFGKPYADYYIDDLAIPSYDNLERELGFYNSMVDTRSFNTISSGTIPIYKKSGEDLSGEIYWYTHMPPSIKDMFPIFISSDYNSYTMERINGIPFSKLMLSEEMTVDHLRHIMNSIERIHHAEIPSTENLDINIYDNYCQKLEERYKKYDYLCLKEF
ncbi:MAG: sugar phosphate nucleotidyltransferase [Nitrososphaerota archaeon]